MLLENKVAMIYGAGGMIGGAVARTFGREGAEVFLAGRTQSKLDTVAEEIRSAGGVAETAQVDALDQHAVDAHVDAVAEQTGRIDLVQPDRTETCKGFRWSRCHSRTSLDRS